MANVQFIISMATMVPVMMTAQSKTSLGPRKANSLTSVTSLVIRDKSCPVFHYQNNGKITFRYEKKDHFSYHAQ